MKENRATEEQEQTTVFPVPSESYPSEVPLQ